MQRKKDAVVQAAAAGAQGVMPFSGVANMPRRRWYILFLLLPGLVLLAAISLYPFFWLIWMSLHEVLMKPGTPDRWVGFTNWLNMFKLPEYRRGWALLAEYTAIAMVLEVGLGMLVAVLINRLRRIEKLLTTIILMPMMVAPVVVGLLWSFLYNASFGWVFWALRSLRILQTDTLLGNVHLALFAVIATDVWEWTPLVVLILLAGLKGVPKDQIEAVWVDGASGWQTFRRVIIPNLRPLLVIAILLRFMDNVRIIDHFIALTGNGGGPAGATRILPMVLYEQAFQFFKLGIGAAIALTLLFVTIMVGNYVVKVFTAKEVEATKTKLEEAAVEGKG
jgi:multiple sugar transport system permease protein